jgi:hypothetical protein
MKARFTYPHMLLMCIFCSGCSRAPSISVIGSFFPVWMLCLLTGTILTFVARVLLVRFGLETEVGPLALFYPSFLTLSTCLLWLVFFQ